MAYFPSLVGNVASDSADSGNPIKIGGKGVSSDITAVTTGDRVDAIFDRLGKQIVLPYGIPEQALSGTGNATTTSDTAVIAAQGAGSRIYVTTLIVANSSATNTRVSIKSGTTEKLVIPAPANSGATITLPTPLRLGDNEALNFASGTAVTTMYVSAVGFKAV